MIMAVETAAALGVTKLRITGGEPLVKRNIVSLCRRAAAVEGIKDLAITTNGVLLPKLGRELKEAGVKRLNISLDTLDADKYAYITRIGTLDSAMAGIEAAIDLGFDKIKLNAVLIGGFNDDEIRPLAELTKKYPLDMRFIEMMPMYDSGDFKEAAFVPYTKVLEVLPELEKAQQDGGVASLYRLPEAKGNIGLISPLNAHFCGTCNRIRLTSDGKLKPCLHSSVEYPIKGLDREGMMEQFKTAIYGKPQWHGELNATERSKAGRNMNQIGG
jgi:cyclic pyranopterin phosphate synthase